MNTFRLINSKTGHIAYLNFSESGYKVSLNGVNGEYHHAETTFPDRVNTATRYQMGWDTLVSLVYFQGFDYAPSNNAIALRGMHRNTVTME